MNDNKGVITFILDIMMKVKVTNEIPLCGFLLWIDCKSSFAIDNKL